MNILSLKRSEIDQNLKNEILNYITDSNIKLDWVSNFKQIMYHFTNKLDHIPKCYCGNFNNFKSSKIGYRKTCSFKCSNSSVDKMEKTKKSKLEKYGDKNYNNMGKNKNSKLEKYGSENYNNRPKAFKTNEVKYGSYSPMKNDAVKKKGKLKKLEKYGNEN